MSTTKSTAPRKQDKVSRMSLFLLRHVNDVHIIGVFFFSLVKALTMLIMRFDLRALELQARV